MHGEQKIITHHFNNSSTGKTALKFFGVHELLVQLWLLAFLVAGIGSVHLWNWKNQFVLDVKQDAANVLEKTQLAFTLVNSGRAEEAAKKLGEARTELSVLLGRVEHVAFWANFVPKVGGVLKVVKSLETALAGYESVFLDLTGEGKGAELGYAEKDGGAFGDVFKPLVSQTAKASQDLDTALSELDADFIFQNIGGQSKEKYMGVASAVTLLTSETKRIASILEDLSNGRKRILFMLQNNNEMRPGGGFFGTYAVVTLDFGALQNLELSSIYDIDGQLEKKPAVRPPYPLLQVNKRWFLRDSNWFANFEDTAAVVDEMFSDVKGYNPDVVVAVTPKFFTRLLDVLGEVYVPEKGVSLNADNFLELMQLQSSVAYDKIENKPKEIFASAFSAFLSKALKAGPASWPKVLQALHQSLLSKDIVLFSQDRRMQEKLRAVGWAGSINPGSRDFLQILWSNLGGTKTDAYIKEERSLESRVETDGSVLNTLTIKRRNPLPKRAGMENLSFLRVLVPFDSELISASGFDSINLEGGLAQSSIDAHPKAFIWEQGMTKDLASGTLIGREAGMTFFGNWVRIEGGESQTVILKYRLPFSLASVDSLSLRHQVQPGSSWEDFTYTIDAPGFAFEGWTEDARYGRDGQELVWDVPKGLDVLLGAVIKSKRLGY